MEVILYNSENEMPCYLRKDKDESWDIIDQNKWEDWCYVPISESQPSKFHSHVTWNSHRQDYFNRARILRETHKVAAMRESADDKMTTANEYEAAEAEANKTKALQSKVDTNTDSNTNPPTTETSFKKLTPTERAAKKAIRNKKYYEQNKTKDKKSDDDCSLVSCSICGGEHKSNSRGRYNHKVSYQHITKLILLHAASAIMKKKADITTTADAEAYIANLIKKAEDKLNRKLTRSEIKNKYTRLAAQYSA